MIENLRKQIMFVIMSILTFVIIIILISLNLFNFTISKNKNIKSMEEILMDNRPKTINNNTNFPTPDFNKNFNDKRPPEYFFLIDLENNFQVLKNFGENFTDEEISTLTTEILAKEKTTGKYKNYRFLIKENKLLVLDTQSESQIFYQLLWISIIISIFSLIILYFLSLFLTKKVISPVEEAFENQVRFIQDASHELKTPLTVINTNFDVLKNQIGTNKWIGFIQDEIIRMNDLVNDLLYLAKLDNVETIYEFNIFSLSKAVYNCVLPFESLIFEENKILELNIEEDIYINGDEKRIKQLIIILLDNAIKYTNKNGLIKISLKKIDNKSLFSVYNTGEGISKEEQENIFKRFYRLDNSRDRNTGGFGLGLSIANSIIRKHKGKINVESELNKYTKFSITLK